MEYLPWLLAFAFAVLVIVFIDTWLREKEAAAEADEQHKQELADLEEQKQNLELQKKKLNELLALSQNENKRKDGVLELIDKTNQMSEGKSWVYVLDNQDGHQIIGADGEELKGTYRKLPRTLATAARKGELECTDARYAVSAGETSDAQVYVLNNVTDHYTILTLNDEIENLHSEIDGYGVEIHSLVGEIHRLENNIAELEETIERSDVVTTVMNLKYLCKNAQSFVDTEPASLVFIKTEANLPQIASFGKSREVYLKACVDVINERFPDCHITRYSEDSLCCLFVGDACEAATKKARIILDMLSEKKGLLALSDGTHTDRNVIEVADYRTGEISKLIFCMDIKSEFDRTESRFGVQQFGEYDYTSILEYKRGMDKLARNKKIKFKYRPIADSINGKVYAYQMTPYFPNTAFKSFEQALYGAILFGYVEEFEEMLYSECMRAYKNAVRDGQLFHNTRVILNSIADACMTNRAERNLYEKYYDDLKNLISEISEEVPAGLDCARIKKKRISEWRASCIVNCTEDSGYNMIKLELLSPDLVRVPAEVACSEEHRQVIVDIKTRIEGKARLVVDEISTPAQLREAIAAGADYVAGPYVGADEYEPPCVSDKCMKQIGLIRFGKKKG